MKTVRIDFEGCKNRSELYLRMAEKLDFPKGYGKNLNALWDILTGFIEEEQIIYLESCSKIASELFVHMEEVIKVFREAEENYGDIRVYDDFFIGLDI